MPRRPSIEKTIPFVGCCLGESDRARRRRVVAPVGWEKRQPCFEAVCQRAAFLGASLRDWDAWLRWMPASALPTALSRKEATCPAKYFGW